MIFKASFFLIIGTMKKIFTVALSLLLLIAPQILRSQNELTVHDGTSTNGYVPIYGYYTDAYLKAEMASSIVPDSTSCLISLAFSASPSTIVWAMISAKP